MVNDYLIEISFFILLALFGTLVSIRLRQPCVVGLLLIGAAAGPHMLQLVKNGDLISTFSDLGAILLLFTVGIEFSVSKLLRHGFRAVLVTFFKMLVLFFFGYEVALYFGLGLTASLFAGAMVSVTSTAIMFKMSSEKKTGGDSIMPLLLSMLIVEDVVAVAALTFFSSLGGGAPTYEDKIYSVLTSLGLLGVFYLFVRRHATNALVRITTHFNEEALIFVAFSLCLVMAYMADFFGLSPAIGAFLAGSIIATLPNSRSIERTIRPLLLTFSALFFLSLGMQINPADVWDHLGLACALAATFIVVCFASVFTLVYSTGSRGKKAMLAASSMVVLGEFSLIIAATATGDMRATLLAVGSFGVVATAVFSSFLLDRQEALMRLARSGAPAWAVSSLREFAAYFAGIVKDFSQKGDFWRVSQVCWSCVSRKLAVIAGILIAMWLARFAAVATGIAAGTSGVEVRGAIAILGLLPILYYVVLILRDLRPVIDTLTHAIARHKRNARDESIILRNIAIATALIILALVLPDTEATLQLPPPFSFADEIAFLLAFAFIWDVIIHVEEIRKRRAKGRGGKK